jgi:hypothetical protein
MIDGYVATLPGRPVVVRGLLVPNAAAPAIHARFPPRRMEHADVWRKYAFELLPLLSSASSLPVTNSIGDLCDAKDAISPTRPTFNGEANAK